ncbi:UNVERIFIED_CONTAM: hypothetical protein K2H54_068646 [Gekko kuhli]
MMDYCTNRVRCSSSCTSSRYGGATLHQHTSTEEIDRQFLEEEDYDADTRIEALERGQQKMKRDLEEVILAIPDMVIQALQAEWEEARSRVRIRLGEVYPPAHAS